MTVLKKIHFSILWQQSFFFPALCILLVSFKNYLACVQAYGLLVQLRNNCEVTCITTFSLSSG